MYVMRSVTNPQTYSMLKEEEDMTEKASMLGQSTDKKPKSEDESPNSAPEKSKTG